MSAAQMRQAQQGLILRGAIVFWYEDCGALIAFRLAANIAHDPIDRDGKAHLIELLDHGYRLCEFSSG